MAVRIHVLARKTHKWLGLFIESVFEANKAALSYWPHDLAKGLAMTVIGIPEVRAE